MNLLNGIRHGHVAGRVARDIERLQNGHAAGNESPQRATEPRDGAFPDQIAEERYAELHRVDHLAPLNRLGRHAVEKDKKNNAADDHEPLVLEEAACSDNELRERGKRFASQHVGEDLLELRHDINEQECHDGDGDDQNDDRVEHSRHDLVLKFLGFLLKIGQTNQHQFHHAAQFAGANHVDVELVENFGVLAERIGERAAALHRVAKLPDCFAQNRIRLLLAQDVQPAQER